MDPLSALAVAAAVFQFLDLGGKALMKAWRKYDQMQLETLNDQKLAEEEKEFRTALEDLTIQISWIRHVPTNMLVSEPPTPAQAQLMQLSSQCIALSSDFERIKHQMKPPSSQGIRSNIHQQKHVGFGLSSRQPISEEDCKECQKGKAEAIAEFHRNMGDIAKVRRQFESLRRNVVDSMLLCLWDDAKRTKQWELHFSKQLDKLIDLLSNAENLAIDSRLSSALSTHMKSTHDRNHYTENSKNYSSSPVLDEEVVRLRNILQPLIQHGKGPLSLKSLAEAISKALETEIEATAAIRKELVKFLWKNDWKLDASMAGDSSAKIDTVVVADAIATGIQFSTIQTREEAVSKSYETTYSWIFEHEPPKKGGTPMWSSFPKWLEDDSKNVYWITGKPGSGKSTIMKLILQKKSLWDSLSQPTESLRLLVVKYYAWLSGNTLQKSLEGLKRTIIFQALEKYPELSSVLTPRRWALCQVLRSISGLPMWEAWEIEESFEALLSSCGETIQLFLFIDGLDEFSMPPIEVIECIRHIKARCHRGLKVCAASRPWTEFQDEFNEGPILQMHLQTQDDIRTFITKEFQGNRGFLEQQQLNSEAATQLLLDITQRANGVFLWVSIVVRHLLALFSEGQLIFQARQTLETLPTDISSLYDAIWSGIREDNISNASIMIQVLRAFDGPVPWLTIWVVEESRFNPAKTNSLPKDKSSKDVALRSLRRKLAALTKCILEVTGSGNRAVVDFIHRTARDWVTQPKKWQSICSSSDQFDPHLCILKAETLILSHKCNIEQVPLVECRDAIPKILWHASEVKDSLQDTSDLVVPLISLERFWYQPGCEELKNIAHSWPILHPGELRWYMNPTFLGLVAQFSILPYIKYVAFSCRGALSHRFSNSSLGLIENAIFGFPYYIKEDPNNFHLPIPTDRRLATVKYLLEQGVYQSEMHSRNGKCSLREEIQRIYEEETEYCSTVVEYLDKRSFKSKAKSIELRFRSLFR